MATTHSKLSHVLARETQNLTLKPNFLHFLLPSVSCSSVHKSFHVKQKGENQFEEIEHMSELDSEILEILELSDQEFKLTMITMLGGGSMYSYMHSLPLSVPHYLAELR